MQTRMWLTGILLVTCVLSGCGLADLRGGGATAAPVAPEPAAESSAPAAASTAAASESSAPADSASAGSGADSESGSGGESAGRSNALARSTFKDGSGQEDLTLDVAVVNLQRRGQLVDLVLSVIVRDEDGNGFATISALVHSPVTLTDRVNLKQHRVVQAANGDELRPTNSVVHTDRELTLTWTFAAPPSGVTAMDVNLSTWPPFRDVPLAS